MGWRRKIFSKFYFKQWSIGVAEENIEDIIRKKKTDITFNWLKTAGIMESYADPCAFKNGNNGSIMIFAEQFTTGKLNGKILAFNYNKETGFTNPRTIISNGSHFSYPLIYNEGGKNYLVAENAYGGGLKAFEYNTETLQVLNKTTITSMPLVDATILKKDGGYWLFASILGEGVFDELHIFYSDNFLGPYTPHYNNPVKKNHNGARPAGKFIEVDGEIYRPSQNCTDYYGQSITIQKITRLSLSEFEEQQHLLIQADLKSEYNFGIHTINYVGNYLVADGQKGHFQPIKQIMRYLKRKLFSNKKRIGFYFCLINAINTVLSGMKVTGYNLNDVCIYF